MNDGEKNNCSSNGWRYIEEKFVNLEIFDRQ